MFAHRFHDESLTKTEIMQKALKAIREAPVMMPISLAVIYLLK